MEQGIALGDPSAGRIRTALVESPPIADLVAPPFEKASARGWTQTLKEDFNDTTLNKCWKTSYEGGVHTLAANGEEEWYVSPEAGGSFSPFHLSNGLLEIAAVTSASQPHSDAHGHPYLSGMIMSEGCFSQTYGYFEMRTKLPSGKGLWPAFWLLPSNHKWPPEIDVFEMFGASNSRHEGGLGWIHTGTVGAGTSAFNNWHKVNIDLCNIPPLWVALGTADNVNLCGWRAPSITIHAASLSPAHVCDRESRGRRKMARIA